MARKISYEEQEKNKRYKWISFSRDEIKALKKAVELADKECRSEMNDKEAIEVRSAYIKLMKVV